MRFNVFRSSFSYSLNFKRLPTIEMKIPRREPTRLILKRRPFRLSFQLYMSIY